ncbi:rna-binding protein [Teratosphaeria destructans]|uniref:Rna-binding protein n=1 Tax=Teratosphaeria destructans TaxID=418781 RepID=A0A9W7W5V3_9PEZI|nr:rna-binding protein [Teratosphaeria destructans]
MDSYRPRDRETYDDDRRQQYAGHGSRRQEREYRDLDGPSNNNHSSSSMRMRERPALDYDGDRGFSIKGAGDRGAGVDIESRKQENIQEDTTEGKPSKLLIITGLAATTSPERIADAIRGLERAESIGGIRRLLLIRDRKSQYSMGYAFAEFHTAAAAKASLEQYESQQGFKIDGSAVRITSPHLYVFQPVAIDKFYTPEQYTFVMPHDGQRYRYRDPYSFAEELMINENPPAPKRSADALTDDGKKTKKVKTTKKSRPSFQMPQTWARKPQELPAGAAAEEAGDGSPEGAANDVTYRDRAAKRRAEEAVAAPTGIKMSLKRPSAPAKEMKAPTTGKGESLLAKAGGSTASSAGSLAQQVLNQDLYRGGVGLGHESSRVGNAVEEAERRTKAEGSGDGRAQYAEKAREVNRARFEAMK